MSGGQWTKRISILVFLVVFGIYFRTMAPTTSFWDCGEFIACAFTMGVPHPPGSPLFIMLGRVFSLAPLERWLQAVKIAAPYSDYAYRVNVMSPLAGALSAVFCYLIILRLIRGWEGPLSKTKEKWSDHFGAVVGTLIFALADSNWFNAVEAEVYAYAIFLMMLALYLGLLWADTVGKPIHLSLVLFLAYLMGLASGMHLLCLLVLPSIAFLGLFTYVNRRDAWVLLVGVSLLVVGGYFALHVQNANRLLTDQFAEPASTYGMSDDAVTYQQVSIVLTILFGASGVVMTFLTRTVNWRDTWIVLLVAAAAALTVRAALDVFFWYQKVGEFPTRSVVVLLALAVAIFFLAQGRRNPVIPPLKAYHIVVALLLLVVVGYSTYLALMVRSGLNPTIDENNPQNWGNLFSFLARKQYGTEDMSMIIFNRMRQNPDVSLGVMLRYQLWDMFAKYLLQQFPASITGALFNLKLTFRSAMQRTYFGMPIPDLPLILLFFGIAWHLEADQKRFLALLVLWVISGLGLVVYLNMPDPQPRERHYVFTGATSVMAIWMGMGVTGLIRMIGSWLPESWPHALREKVAPYSMAVIGAVVPIWFLVGYPLADEYSADFSVRYGNWAKHDRLHDTVGYDYAYNILASCDSSAVLFTNGDNDTFPLWYLQEVVGHRKDVRVVNLSLVNTDWYIQQLRDNEPKIPMSEGYTDDWISNVLCGATLQSLTQSGRIDVGENGSAYDKNSRLIGWQTKEVSAGRVDTIHAELTDGRVVRGVLGVPRRGYIVVKEPGHDRWEMIPTSQVARQSTGMSFPGITWSLPAAPEYRILRIQDVMVYKIIDWIKWRRPVYFAVTVSPENLIGLDRYLRMEGMVLRVVQEPGPGIAAGRGQYGLTIDRSIYNLDKVYQIRFVRDQTIYRDDNMLQLMRNYRSAYLRLADEQIDRGDVEGARATLVKFEERLPLDWAGAYHGASVSRRGGPRLEDYASRYALAADTIIRREMPTTDVFDQYMLEQVRATSQLLRFSGHEKEAAELLLEAEPYMRRASPYSGLNEVDRVGVLYEAGIAYRQAKELLKAREVLGRCNTTLAAIPPTAEANQEFRREFRVDRATFEAEVARQLAGIEEAITRTSPGTGDSGAPDTSRPGPK